MYLNMIQNFNFSVKIFSAEVGEDQKTPCPFANQENRDTKVVDNSGEDVVKDSGSTSVSK